MAVGTTSTRTLESAVDDEERFNGAEEARISLSIRDTEFRIIDSLITNFHLPKSTLLMLISAFYDREKILSAYEEAKKEGYRFFSYGDAMFIV